jgi:hypothetical protein
MGELLSGIDFKAKSRKYTKTEEPLSFAAIEAEITAALWGSTPSEYLIPDVTIYESSIGYVAPEKDPA